MSNINEHQLRRRANDLGLFLRKSRVTTPNFDDFGGFMLTDNGTNCVAIGSRFEWSLEDVAKLVR